MISGFFWWCCNCQCFVDFASMYLAGQVKERGGSELGSKREKAVTCVFRDYAKLIIAFFLLFLMYYLFIYNAEQDYLMWFGVHVINVYISQEVLTGKKLGAGSLSY